MNDSAAADTPVADSDEVAIRDMLRAWRRRHVEPVWAQLNRPDAAQFAALWQGLQDTGLTACARPEDDGGIALDGRARVAALATLGATSPSIAAALVAHLAAQALLVEAGGGRWPAGSAADGAFALLASPLDVQPATAFTLAGGPGAWRLHGEQRVMLPPGATGVIPARNGDRLCLCVVDPAADGLAFRTVPSSHGLCLLPFGDLRATDVALADAQVHDWPASGHAANVADALLTALVTGMIDELAQRAGDYARQRYQAGKMISEHHAVQQMLGPIELARRPLRSLAAATLATTRPGDGSASAFAIAIARRSALDAIQAFGGYGYMEDYRVERYLRDANTLETFWIHAAQRERAVAIARCASLARGEDT